jgi:hypothetical protein
MPPSRSSRIPAYSHRRPKVYASAYRPPRHHLTAWSHIVLEEYNIIYSSIDNLNNLESLKISVKILFITLYFDGIGMIRAVAGKPKVAVRGQAAAGGRHRAGLSS